MNLYVIDDATREPVEGAEVVVGDVTGTTDADGLFVAEGVVGPQTIAVKPGGNLRQEVWFGANGANVTINAEASNQGSVERANLSGTIPNITSQALGTNIVRIAVVTYSQTDELGDPQNELEQPASQNICFVTQPADPCAFTITARTGSVALLAQITERDTKGTEQLEDDDVTVIGYAIRRGITVVANQNQSNQTLAMLSGVQTLTLDLDTPPAALTSRASLVSLELGDEGVLPIGFADAATTTMIAPQLSAVSGAVGYRYVAFATDGAPTDTRQSAVVRTAQPGPTLAAGEWLDPPATATLSRTRFSFTNVDGATVHGFEIRQGATAVANLTVLDSSIESFDIPELITLPSAELVVDIGAIAADGLDVTNFSLDADRDKLNRVSNLARTLP